MAAAPASLAKDAATFREALRRADGGDGAAARQMIAGHKDPLLGKVVEWLDMTRSRNSAASFIDITNFIQRNQDWPSQASLRRRAEEASGAQPSHAVVMAWFEQHPPISRDGRLRMLEALRAAGKDAEALALVRRIWIEDGFGAVEERDFLKRFGPLIRPEDDAARLDRQLWREQAESARRQMARVDAGQRALAEARLKLQASAKDVEAALKAVPADMRNDAGLLYDRMKYKRKKGDGTEPRQILLKAPQNLIRPELWWDERERQVRRAIDDNEISLAYKLARDHRLTGSGPDFAEGEWLAGWLAFRLKDWKAAAQHFASLYDNTRSAISQGRGGYWAGRTAEMQGRSAEAKEWYRKSAVHITTFYGQLSAARLGVAANADLPRDPVPSKEDAAAFARREVPRVVRRLVEIGEPQRIDAFLFRLADTVGTPEGVALTARLARELGRTDLGVSVARRAQRDGLTLVDAGFPLLADLPGEAPELALVHALIRQESNYAIEAISRAGARGLMQLMPATARESAGKLSMPYAVDRLTSDPAYNVTLGRYYLGSVLDSFAGSYVLSLAAYNAGPGRVRQWIARFGDPRNPGVDVVDWIERIPFNETRNYVQRVLEGLQVYRLRLGTTGAIAIERRPLKPNASPAADSPWCVLACAVVVAATDQLTPGDRVAPPPAPVEQAPPQPALVQTPVPIRAAPAVIDRSDPANAPD